MHRQELLLLRLYFREDRKRSHKYRMDRMTTLIAQEQVSISFFGGKIAEKLQNFAQNLWNYSAKSAREFPETLIET